MSDEEKPRSVLNLEKLEKLSSELEVTGIRLMIDPEKPDASAEAVVEDLCRLMEYKLRCNAEEAAGTWLLPEGARSNCYPKY